MKCNHEVRSYHWQRCAKCGKIVRISRLRRWLALTLMAVVVYVVVPKIADAAIRILHLESYNPYNITHALIGVILDVAAFYLIIRVLPLYDEK